MARRSLVLALGVMALATTAAPAADMPPSRYEPPPLRTPTFVPFFSWTGAYAGINAGYGFGKSNWTDTVTALSTGDFDVSGAMVGATLGYNMQLGAALLSLETDIDWANIKGSSTVNCTTSCDTELQWLGTARARLGWAFDRFLPYITGGAAYGSVRTSLTGIGTASTTRIGWTAGGGLEYAFLNNWTMKAEYLYVDLGTATCDAACTGGTPADVTFQSHLVRGGVNFKF